MKIALTLAALSAALLSAASESQDNVAKKIRELHKERVATLKSLVDLTLTLKKNEGAASSREVLEIQLLLLGAELDAAESDQERIHVQESIVELLKKLESILERARSTGEYPIIEFFKVKADRLKAEIALEQLKSNFADRPK